MIGRRGQTSIEVLILAAIIVVLTVAFSYLVYNLYSQTSTQVSSTSSEIQKLKQKIDLNGKTVLIYGATSEVTQLKEILESAGAQVDVVQLGGISPTEAAKYDVAIVIAPNVPLTYVASGDCAIRVYPYSKTLVTASTYGSTITSEGSQSLDENILYKDVLDRLDVNSYHVVQCDHCLATSLRFSSKDRSTFPDGTTPPNRNYMQCNIWQGTYMLNAVYTAYLKTFIPRDLIIVAQYPETHVSIKDLTDKDDSREVTLEHAGQMFVYVSTGSTCTSSRAFDNDIVEIKADKPVLILYGVFTTTDMTTKLIVPTTPNLKLYLPPFFNVAVISLSKTTLKKASLLESVDQGTIYTQIPIPVLYLPFEFDVTQNYGINLDLVTISDYQSTQGFIGRGIKLSGYIEYDKLNIPSNSFLVTMFLYNISTGEILSAPDISLSYDGTNLVATVFSSSISLPVKFDSWHFVAILINNNEACLFVDDKYKCTSVSPTGTINYIRITAQGYVDEIRVYSGTASPDFVLSLYRSYTSHEYEPPVEVQSTDIYYLYIYTTTLRPILTYGYGNLLATVLDNTNRIWIYNPTDRVAKVILKFMTNPPTEVTLVVQPHEVFSKIVYCIGGPVVFISDTQLYFGIEPYGARNAIPQLEPVQVDSLDEMEESRILQLMKNTKVIFVYSPQEYYSILPIRTYGFVLGKDIKIRVDPHLQNTEQFSVISTIQKDLLETSFLPSTFLPIYYLGDKIVVGSTTISNKVVLVPHSLLDEETLSIFLALVDYI